jgi:hypothetical protein
MPPSAGGFPSQHDVSFDLLPMSIESVASNLFYWDGSDSNGGGIDLTDVNFVVPTEVHWDVFDANFATTTADATDQSVSGGLVQTTSSDIWPDGVDSGTIHKHLALQVRDSDGSSSTTAPAGVYLLSWQARSAGFEASDPFFFVHRTPTIADTIRDVAVSWVESNIKMLTSPPQILGDYNDDGSVDAADYIVWRKTFGQTGSDLPADGDGDGEVAEPDYIVWRENYAKSGGSTGAGPAVVPEPESTRLIVIAVVLFSTTTLVVRKRESALARVRASSFSSKAVLLASGVKCVRFAR